MNKLFIAFISLFLFVTAVNAQEICNDGIDNDGDGFVDCFDSDCSDNADCAGFYLGNDASCEAEPNAFPVFSLSLGYQSANNVTNNLSRIAIGDLDRDGIPEIVTQNKYTDRVYVLNGDDASIKATGTVNNPDWRASIVNLEDDNCAEVFAVSGGRIFALDCNLNELWVANGLSRDPVHLGFADFDRDGIAEMYYKDEIRDPISGTRLVPSSTADWYDIGGGPVAVDILGDGDLELVLNNKIYSVNLGARSEDAGFLTLLETMPAGYQVKYRGTSSTSIADYNLDGFLDVIVSGADENGITTVFFWDVHNNTVKEFSDRIDENNYRNGWRNGTGRINIGDLDGDGQLNAAFVSGKYLYALDENWEPLWKDAFGDPLPTQVNEETSGVTGCTLFDFNGDGKNEVVYRDEDYLYIVNGTDGSINTSIHCRSRTNVEYPIVADVDADGSTEICVVCTSENHRTGTRGENLSLDAPAELRIYKSAGEPWVPARRVWNQHGYFNVNINDDLTVPRTQQRHHLVWSDGTCTDGPVRPLNNFLNQSPFLSSDGCPTYASPDLNIVENSFTITQPDCPDTDFTVSFQIENIGDVALSGDVPITFYDGDPLVAGTNRLNTEFITLNNFSVGQVDSAVDINISGNGSQFTLYAVLNDDGSTAPTPITLPSTNFLECDYLNNIVTADVNPFPFNLSTVTTNNITCASGAVPSNGSARVFKDEGGTEITADYDFFWFDGTDVTGTPDFTGPIYTGLSAGTYTVYATHKTAGCSSDTAQVVIADSARVLTADITVNQPNDNCENPNGRLTVSLNGGDPVGNFTYEWYEGNSVGGGLQISTSHVATGLESGTYTVLVTEKATGCQTIESREVPDNTVAPDVSVSAVDIICSDANSGSVTANVTGGNNGHTFEWYIGPSVKPTPDFTGNTVNNLPQGDYTVVVTNNASGCPSEELTVTVDQTLVPEISGVSSTDNNSCDSSLPNGSATVTIVGDPAEHTIEWFAGGSTTTAVIGTGLILEDVAAGEYTVRLTNNATGCFVTERVNVINNIIQPNVSLAADPVTQCSPFNGRVTASVDLDDLSDYTFSWYEGELVKAATDFSETGNVIENLEPGFYTVEAFHTTRNCTDVQTIEVIDEATVNIVQEDDILSLPTACDEDDGVLQVEVDSPNNTSGFFIEWYEGSTVSGTPFQTDNGVSVSTASDLFTGLYTVVATDLDNGCSSQRVFDLPFLGAHELDSIRYQNATTCIPNNGSIEVLLTPSSGTTLADYQLILSREEAGSYVEVDRIDGTDPPIFNGLPEGTYIIEALSDVSGCSVYLPDAIIDLEATDPVISNVTRQPNTNCSVVTANGSITIEIDNGADPADYTINWFEGDDTSEALGTNTSGVAAGANGEIATNLTGGEYTVEVINDITECSIIRTYSIVDNPTVVSVATADIQISPITQCDVNDSEVTIVEVNENGSPANIADYTFEWYDENMNLLPSATSPNTTNTISGLAEGTYFVRAVNGNTDCETSLNEFFIENEIVEPVIAVAAFGNPQRCNVNPANAAGFLEISVTGLTGTFSVDWFEGNDTSTPIGTNTTGSVSAFNDLRAENLEATFYTVRVFDNASNCEYVETYELETEVNEVVIAASATPVTNCDTDDGTVFAAVTSGGGPYSYTWTNQDGNVVGTDAEVAGLPEGEYTVVAVDNGDNFCETTATVTIVNDQQFPDLAVEQIAPLTVCDLSLANGVARASVNGEFVGYTFDWFEGSTATGSIVYTGVEFSQMSDITYTVRATDNISQCTSEQTITITSDIPAVPDPTIEVISQDTHCSVNNGALRVDVNGNTANYIFNWYEGEEATGTPYFVGEAVSDLAAGIYSVTATDVRTGCVSEVVSAEVLEDLNYPEFDFEVEGVSCGNDNGFASLIILNDIEIGRIEWTNASGNLVTTGPNLTNATAGVYTVYVESAVGCVLEKEVTIPTEINAFNGISRNGDSRNNYFKIDCISNFPNNLVKIYNRAGTLVYEANGYDNNTIVFDGISNKGLNLMGTNVPDGTYFYVIDKGNGSKPVTGYLEIVN